MADKKADLTASALLAKRASGKTFDQIAAATGLTNAFVANLFYFQAQLKPSEVEKLRSAVPDLSDELIAKMQECPFRGFNPEMVQEPFIYRLYEAIMHYGEGLKAVVNEKFGDGIMSAIDMYCTVDKIKGVKDELRAVITFNGKFLPYADGKTENNAAKLATPTIT